MTPQPFALPVRVYYEDTDAAGVVYYANYLKFMERARTEWLAALGFRCRCSSASTASCSSCIGARSTFCKPARLNDALAVTVEVGQRGACRLVTRQEVRRGETTLTSARVTLACVDATRWRPVRIPAPLAIRMETPA
jgi:acyl-CoA thioester hydrolase